MVEGTRQIMEAAAAHKAKVILTSSITTYGIKIQTDISYEDAMKEIEKSLQ